MNSAQTRTGPSPEGSRADLTRAVARTLGHVATGSLTNLDDEIVRLLKAIKSYLACTCVTVEVDPLDDLPGLVWHSARRRSAAVADGAATPLQWAGHSVGRVWIRPRPTTADLQNLADPFGSLSLLGFHARLSPAIAQLRARQHSDDVELGRRRDAVVEEMDRTRNKLEHELQIGARVHLEALKLRFDLLARLLTFVPGQATPDLPDLDFAVQHLADQATDIRRQIVATSSDLDDASAVGRGLRHALFRIAPTVLPRGKLIVVMAGETSTRRFPTEVEVVAYHLCLHVIKVWGDACTDGDDMYIEFAVSSCALQIVIRATGIDTAATDLAELRSRVDEVGGTLGLLTDTPEGSAIAIALPY